MYYSITLYFNDKNFESKCQCSEKIKRRVTKKQSEKGTLVGDYLYLIQSPPTFKRYNMGPAGCIRSYGALQMVVLNGQLGL